MNPFTPIIVILVAVLYFLPTIVAWRKKHAAGIFILNLFLGWTVLGWIGALIWAVTSPDEKVINKR